MSKSSDHGGHCRPECDAFWAREREKKMEAGRKTYKEVAYCEDCLATVSDRDECLCLGDRDIADIQAVLDAKGCGAAVEPLGGCCGGRCRG